MTETLPVVYLSRHGDTAWRVTGQHTGLTDMPLTAMGEHHARKPGERLRGLAFARVFTSPLQRAAKTCELAGFGVAAEIDPDLVEWNYGEYEGLRSDEILAKRPDWELFRDGCPDGESPEQVGERADRVVHSCGGCASLLYRTLHSRFGCPLAGARRRIRRKIFSIEHGEPQRGELRAQPLATGDIAMER